MPKPTARERRIKRLELTGEELKRLHELVRASRDSLAKRTHPATDEFRAVAREVARRRWLTRLALKKARQKNAGQK